MDTQSVQQLEDVVKETLTGWKDHRLVDLDEMVGMLMFLVYGQNVCSQFGADWTGCSFSQSETSCLLVARRLERGVPQVAFITGRTPTDCMRLYHKRLKADLVEWVRDKYR